MQKRTFFFIDDIIWLFRDLTKHRPRSAFDNPFLSILKEAHEKHGAKVQLNVFLETDDYYGGEKFRLSDMTDAYIDEFRAASDWLRFGLHARSEFPDFPYVNADLAEMRDVLGSIKREILRFAGEESFARGMVTHWLPMSREGGIAAKELGIKIISATYGDRIEYRDGLLSEADTKRLFTNKKPESGIFLRKNREGDYLYSLCSHNHLCEEIRQLTDGTLNAVFDGMTELYFKRFCSGHVLNLLKKDEIIPLFEPYMEKEFFCFANHEQYFYSDYKAYQPDYAEKVLLATEYVAKMGYEYFFIEELAK